MAKQRWKGNTIYISQRLREELRPIDHCALTTVVAPMGYGKTTAVSWYLAERIRQQQAAVLRVSVYSDSLPIFWQSVQAAFTHAGIDLLRDYECPQDEASASLLIDDLCRTLALLGPCYLFIDDFHLLADPRASAFLCVLARRLPENAHLIVAGRDEFLPPQEVLRLGRHVWRIGAAQLRLEREELEAYARRCGAELSDHQVEQLLAAIDARPDMSGEERGNLRGECDLIMSFLLYNDIAGMSRLHRSASAQMSRPAVSIRRQGGWTFGSPSVLMMFHRQAGRLDCELAEMDECMPHYYCVTNGHGQGAEHIMRGEAAFLRGQLDDARIALAGAYAQIRDNGQENMALCCDHLAWRLSLCTGETPRQDFDQRRRELLCQHNAAWLNILNSTDAYYHALIGETESIPEVFREHRLASVRYLAPGKPMMELIENQVYLAQGAYAEVIGRSRPLLAVCDAMHYALVSKHVQLQTAGACEMLGRRAEARGLLEQVLQDAAADGLVMPVVENYRYLAPLLADMPQRGDVPHMIELGRRYEARCASVRQRSAVPAAFHVLTPRERDIAMLVAARLSNREIAEKLYLSEGSVKQYVNRIYAKLFIEGDTRTKRKRLVEMTQH